MRVHVGGGHTDLHPVHWKDVQRSRPLRLVIDVGRWTERRTAERSVLTDVAAVHVVCDAGRATAERTGIGAVVSRLEQAGNETLTDHPVPLPRLAGAAAP